MNLNALKAMVENLSYEELGQLRAILDEIHSTTTMPPDVAEVFNKSDTPATTDTVNNDMDFTMSKPRRGKAPVRATGVNSFVDDGTEAREDTSTPEYTPTPRRRKAPTMRDVKCSACGKTFAKHESLIHGEYHRCDRCCGGR